MQSRQLRSCGNWRIWQCICHAHYSIGHSQIRQVMQVHSEMRHFLTHIVQSYVNLRIIDELYCAIWRILTFAVLISASNWPDWMPLWKKFTGPLWICHYFYCPFRLYWPNTTMFAGMRMSWSWLLPRPHILHARLIDSNLPKTCNLPRVTSSIRSWTESESSLGEY